MRLQQHVIFKEFCEMTFISLFLYSKCKNTARNDILVYWPIHLNITMFLKCFLNKVLINRRHRNV